MISNIVYALCCVLLLFFKNFTKSKFASVEKCANTKISVSHACQRAKCWKFGGGSPMQRCASPRSIYFQLPNFRTSRIARRKVTSNTTMTRMRITPHLAPAPAPAAAPPPHDRRRISNLLQRHNEKNKKKNGNRRRLLFLVGII